MKTRYVMNIVPVTECRFKSGHLGCMCGTDDSEQVEEKYRKRQICLSCRKISLHKYIHGSWSCCECGKDEWLWRYLGENEVNKALVKLVVMELMNWGWFETWLFQTNGRIDQLVESLVSEARCPGSSPGVPTIFPTVAEQAYAIGETEKKLCGPNIREIWVRIPSVGKRIENDMKNKYKFIFALLVCLVSGCPRSTPIVDSGVDVQDTSVVVSSDVLDQ